MAAPVEPPLPLRGIVAYASPSVAVGTIYFLSFAYLPKFATDVLLIAPATMALLFGLSRLWDAVSDPLAGYLSDRTRTRLGRRRSWMLASTLPLALTFWMVWSPPRGLSDTALTLWLGAGMFALLTALTLFTVPHLSLGAELSRSHHDRTRIFGVREVMSVAGAILGLVAFKVLLLSEHGAESGFGAALVRWLRIPDDPRETARALSLIVAALAALLVPLAVAGTRERAEYQGRGGSSPWRAFGDVFRNPHARVVLWVLGIQSTGRAAQGILTAYHMQYIIGVPTFAPELILVYMLPSMLLVPLWVHLSRRLGKRPVWIGALCAMAATQLCLFTAQEGDIWLVFVLAIVSGAAGGCSEVVAMSVKADVIDWDEYRTGERKEGSYFAVWTTVQKAAFALMGMLVMGLLDVLGFEPNAEQSDAMKLGMRAIVGLVPAVFTTVAVLSLLRLRFGEAEHARIRAAIDARNG